MPAPAAFRQQLLGAIPRLRRYARSLVFDASAADDLVQTALERALTHWHQFDQRRDILVWTDLDRPQRATSTSAAAARA